MGRIEIAWCNNILVKKIIGEKGLFCVFLQIWNTTIYRRSNYRSSFYCHCANTIFERRYDGIMGKFMI